jgi:apolipoprotein N-acyltransferase
MVASNISIHRRFVDRLCWDKARELQSMNGETTNFRFPAATRPATPVEVLPLGWATSFLWLGLAVTCFHAAYTSLRFPAAGFLILGYAFALARLTDQATVRRAFYFGLAAGFFCYAPQLWFFHRIFNVAAVVLWLVPAFWIGLFAAIACGCIRRWGRFKAAFLLSVVWTGLEYFRSELYYLKFSWLNLGYALPPCLSRLVGMYGLGFLVFLFAAVCLALPRRVLSVGLFSFVLALSFLIPAWTGIGSRPIPPGPVLPLVGVQMEFPPENVIPKMLDRVLAKNTNAQIFVLSEYTLNGPVPEALKDWCRKRSRYLVVGGEAPAGTNNYCDTAFVVGADGRVIFKQGKRVPIPFFRDGLPAPNQQTWHSPWGVIGFCVCYDLSYTRVTDELVRQGAQLLIVPTMDVEYWGRHEHELHTRVAPVRAAEYGLPIFRLASSGISQAVSAEGEVVAEAPMPGNGAVLAATLHLAGRGSPPLDRILAPACTGLTALLTLALLWLARKEARAGGHGRRDPAAVYSAASAQPPPSAR